MEIAERKIRKGNRIPYGTLADASAEIKQAYYYHGYRNDEDLPELPVGSVYDSEEPPPDPDEVVARNEMHRVVAEILDGLTRREAQVLRMRFGIDLDADLTLEEVGGKFDVTRERIRQIEAKALRKLKHPSRRDVLVQFVCPDSIRTTADRQREREEALKYLIRTEMELHAKEMARRKGWSPLTKWQPETTSWVDYLQQNSPDVYASLKAHVERYAHKYLPR